MVSKDFRHLCICVLVDFILDSGVIIRVLLYSEEIFTIDRLVHHAS